MTKSVVLENSGVVRGGDGGVAISKAPPRHMHNNAVNSNPFPYTFYYTWLPKKSKRMLRNALRNACLP